MMVFNTLASCFGKNSFQYFKDHFNDETDPSVRYGVCGGFTGHDVQYSAFEEFNWASSGTCKFLNGQQNRHK